MMRRGMMAAIAAMALLVTLPAGVGAAPPEDSCASFRHVAFTAAVPSGFRTSGHHAFEFLTTWVDPDGTPQQDSRRTQWTSPWQRPPTSGTCCFVRFPCGVSRRTAPSSAMSRPSTTGRAHGSSRRSIGAGRPR